MNESIIEHVWAWEAFDSRGRPTVACRVRLTGGQVGRAVMPSGASTGNFEAREKRDGGTRFGGWGVGKAVDMVNTTLADAVVGLDAMDLERVDLAMESLDSDEYLGSLGSNSVLAVSVSTMLASAKQQKSPLWQVLSGSAKPLLPMPMVNVISGGAHAHGAIDIQDVLVIPLGAQNFAQAIQWAWEVRRATSELFETFGFTSALVADEGGLAGSLPRNEAALDLVTDGIRKSGFEPGRDVAIALDLAANQFYEDERYKLRTEKVELSSEEWLQQLKKWCDSYPIASIEDPLHEDDWEGWKSASSLFGGNRQLLGDDLFATNLGRLERGISNEVANAVLIKPNQSGTITRTIKVLEAAKSANYGTVVSARSGDSEDYWLADLAVGLRSGQIKVGSTQRSERNSKWNRLLEIEAEFGTQSEFGHL